MNIGMIVKGQGCRKRIVAAVVAEGRRIGHGAAIIRDGHGRISCHFDDVSFFAQDNLDGSGDKKFGLVVSEKLSFVLPRQFGWIMTDMSPILHLTNRIIKVR